MHKIIYNILPLSSPLSLKLLCILGNKAVIIHRFWIVYHKKWNFMRWCVIGIRFSLIHIREFKSNRSIELANEKETSHKARRKTNSTFVFEHKRIWQMRKRSKWKWRKITFGSAGHLNNMKLNNWIQFVKRTHGPSNQIVILIIIVHISNKQAVKKYMYIIRQWTAVKGFHAACCFQIRFLAIIFYAFISNERVISYEFGWSLRKTLKAFSLVVCHIRRWMYF